MPNDDLISRSALLEIYKKWLPQLTKPEDAGDRNGVETCIAVLEEAPTVDAEPVRHATWSKNISGGFVFCSACYGSSFGRGCFAFPNRPEITIWRYCPNCGAKMDLKEDG